MGNTGAPIRREDLKAILQALELQEAAVSSLMGEYVSKKGPATDWAVVNEAGVECSKAIKLLRAVLK